MDEHQRLRPVSPRWLRPIGSVVAFVLAVFLGGPVLVALFVLVFAVMTRTFEWWVTFWWG